MRCGRGRRVTLAVGLAAMAGGYGGLWLAASGRAAPPYWALVGLTSAAFAGGSWVDTACIATNVRNFPGHRGTVVGAARPERAGKGPAWWRCRFGGSAARLAVQATRCPSIARQSGQQRELHRSPFRLVAPRARPLGAPSFRT